MFTTSSPQIKKTPLIALLCLCLAALQSGCTASMQDGLFKKATSMLGHFLSLEPHTIKVKDVEMSYLERKGDGPAVMLIHGFTANKETWLKMVAHVPDNWRVIIPDLAGHGDTSLPADGDYKLDAQAKRLKILADKLNIDQVHLVGNSMGGAISVIYATFYPQRVASVTLIDSAGVEAPKQSELFAALEQGHNPLIVTDEKSFEYRWNFVMEKPMFLPWPLRPALVRDTIKRASVFRAVFEDMLATQKLMPPEEFAHDMIKHMTMPVLIIWGKKDRVLDVSSVGEFKRALPHAKVVIFDELGHAPMVEEPSDTADAIADFIQAI